MPVTIRSLFAARLLSGKAPDLVYLWINNDKVEIRDVTHLRGKGCIPTKETLDKLGLGYVSKDLLEREILTDNGNPSVKATSAETEKK